MTRWTVFDPSTENAAHQFSRDTELHEGGNVASALNDALQQQRTVVLVLPAGDETATVARITPPQHPPR